MDDNGTQLVFTPAVNGAAMAVEIRNRSGLQHAGPIVLSARSLRALRDVAHFNRLPEEPLAPEHRRVALAQGLRELADWVETAPEEFLPLRVETACYPTDNIETAQAAARALVPASKDFDTEFFRVRRAFGPEVSHSIVFYRSTVCTSRVVGHKVVPAVSYPERTEDIVEWNCHAILSGGEDSPPTRSAAPDEIPF